MQPKGNLRVESDNEGESEISRCRKPEPLSSRERGLQPVQITVLLFIKPLPRLQ